MRLECGLWLMSILLLLGAVPLQALEGEEGVEQRLEDLRDPFSIVRAKYEAPPPPYRDHEEDDAEALLVGAALSRAETALTAGQHKEALAQCGKGLKLLAGFKDPGRKLEWTRLREKILCARIAAERLIRRQEIEQAFRALDLRLQGILVSEHGSLALLNGKLLERGDCVPLPGEAAGLRIEEIRAREVICNFRGLRMALSPCLR